MRILNIVDIVDYICSCHDRIIISDDRDVISLFQFVNQHQILIVCFIICC